MRTAPAAPTVARSSNTSAIAPIPGPLARHMDAPVSGSPGGSTGACAAGSGVAVAADVAVGCGVDVGRGVAVAVGDGACAITKIGTASASVAPVAVSTT